jgi:phosphoglucosamine mutase
MSRKYFGTDGVRGRVGGDPMTADFAMRLASAAAQVLVADGGRVVIGKDTRLSGYMFESALEAGFVAAGADVLLLGPLPTPGIAQLTQRLFFDRNGSKLSDDIELQIEAHLAQPAITRESGELGSAKRIDDALIQYQQFAAATFPEDLTLKGYKIVFDGAHGAGYKAGPRTLSELGAEVIPIGCSPNGRNINDGCGSTHTELMQLTVPAVKADVGIALDGDGDRVVMSDENGALIDGDQMLYILAKAHHDMGTLRGPVVGTVMSNLGLEHALLKAGIQFKRAKVGDRYVLEELRQSGGNIGGETSGHMLVLDQTTTGDGLVCALQMLAIMRQSGKKLSELTEGMAKYPQTMVNVRTQDRFDPTQSTVIQDAVVAAEAELADAGRVVLRASGTEPLIRVMVEGEDREQVIALAERLAAVVADATT